MEAQTALLETALLRWDFLLEDAALPGLGDDKQLIQRYLLFRGLRGVWRRAVHDPALLPLLRVAHPLHALLLLKSFLHDGGGELLEASLTVVA